MDIGFLYSWQNMGRKVPIRRFPMDKKVAVIIGSDTDLPVVKGTINTLKMFEIITEVHVMSAHRTPD